MAVQTNMSAEKQMQSEC